MFNDLYATTEITSLSNYALDNKQTIRNELDDGFLYRPFLSFSTAGSRCILQYR